MLQEINKFLIDNFEISLNTYLRLTDGTLKKLLKAEIKNFMENQEEKKISDKELEMWLSDAELFIEVLPLFEKMSKRGKQATIDTFIICLLEEV